MDFIFYYDNHKFKANQKEVDSIIRKLNLFYKYCDQNTANLSVLIIDSPQLEEYVQNKIKNFETPFILYDIGKDHSLELKELNEIIHSKKQVYIKGIPEYLSYLKDIMQQNKELNQTPESRFYTNITLVRDSLFLKEKAKIIFILDSKQYNHFFQYGNNLLSYCNFRKDFNFLFKLVTDDTITLDKYLQKKEDIFTKNKTEITIKEVKKNQLKEAFYLCFDELEKFKSKDIESKNIYYTISNYYHQQNNTLILGAYHHNHLIGVLEIKDNYISQIAVMDQYQHQGIGYQLFLEAIKDKKENTQIYLDADKTSVEIYKKWGFTLLENDNNYSKMIYIIQKEKKDDIKSKKYQKKYT